MGVERALSLWLSWSFKIRKVNSWLRQVGRQAKVWNLYGLLRWLDLLYSLVLAVVADNVERRQMDYTSYYEDTVDKRRHVLKPGYFYIVRWADLSGKHHIDYFMTVEQAVKFYGTIALSYVHAGYTAESTEELLRDFLSLAPLHNIKIVVTKT